LSAEKGPAKKEDVVVHWKCENISILKESLMIPITNALKERALRAAARQRMSEREKERRSLTGLFTKYQVLIHFVITLSFGSGSITGSGLLVKNVQKPDISCSVFYYSAIMILLCSLHKY